VRSPRSRIPPLLPSKQGPLNHESTGSCHRMAYGMCAGMKSNGTCSPICSQRRSDKQISARPPASVRKNSIWDRRHPSGASPGTTCDERSETAFHRASAPIPLQHPSPPEESRTRLASSLDTLGGAAENCGSDFAHYARREDLDPALARAQSWCPGAESNHRHGDFQSTSWSGQARANRRESVRSRDPCIANASASLMHQRKEPRLGRPARDAAR